MVITDVIVTLTKGAGKTNDDKAYHCGRKSCRSFVRRTTMYHLPQLLPNRKRTKLWLMKRKLILIVCLHRTQWNNLGGRNDELEKI